MSKGWAKDSIITFDKDTRLKVLHFHTYIATARVAPIYCPVACSRDKMQEMEKIQSGPTICIQ